jgi:hypothetical protein
MRRIRGAIKMGLAWAAGWALFGLLIGVTSLVFPNLPWWDSFFAIFDAPLPALAIPGFVGGVIFSIVLGFAARRRRFDELSVPQFFALGALGGLILSMVPVALVAGGLATPNGDGPGIWRVTAAISGPLTFLSAVSASASLLLARRAKQGVLLEQIEADPHLRPGDDRPRARSVRSSARAKEL